MCGTVEEKKKLDSGTLYNGHSNILFVCVRCVYVLCIASAVCVVCVCCMCCVCYVCCVSVVCVVCVVRGVCIMRDVWCVCCGGGLYVL